jgi:hypothetical protein
MRGRRRFLAIPIGIDAALAQAVVRGGAHSAGPATRGCSDAIFMPLLPP